MDIVIGDPHNIPHPVRWIGNLISRLDLRLLGDGPDKEPDPSKREARSEYRRGLFLVISVVLIVCAGMKYAAYVESIHHKDVLTSAELKAESLVNKLLNGLIDPE